MDKDQERLDQVRKGNDIDALLNESKGKND